MSFREAFEDSASGQEAAAEWARKIACIYDNYDVKAEFQGRLFDAYIDVTLKLTRKKD